MAETCSSNDTSFAWDWVIEYLASFKQIHPSILYDLIGEAPVDLGQNTRELVALKCLELLFTNDTNEPASDVSNSKLTFDLHEPCEHVLLSILKEVTVADFKVTGTDLLRWDIHPFILQKRASLPKSALEQLKDAILEDTHRCAALLRKLGGLVHKNDDNNGRSLNCGTDNTSTGTQIMAPEGSNIQLPLENENGMVGGDSHQNILLSLKRKGNDLHNMHLAGDHQEDQGGVDDGDHLLNAKRFRTDASCASNSGEQIVSPQSWNKSVKDSQLEPLCEHQPSDDVHVNIATIERHGRNSSSFTNDDFQHNQFDGINNANKIPQTSPGDGAGECDTLDGVSVAEPRVSVGEQSLGDLEKGSVDSTRDNGVQADQLNQPNVFSMSQFPGGVTQGGTENLNQDDTSSESSGHHHEKVDVGMEKSHFLSSQHTIFDVSLCDWTEINRCVQCGKDGQLLVCTAVGCPIVVHENCLGCSPKFDDNGNFYCPFCAYSYAISECLQARKKATWARKELAAFIHKQPDRSHNQKLDNLEQDRNEDHLDKTSKKGGLGEGEPDQTNNKEHAYEANGQLKKTRGDKQTKKPTLSCKDVNAMTREHAPDVTHGKAHISSVENGSEEMTLECPSTWGHGQQDQTSDSLKCHSDIPMSKDKEMAASDKNELEGEIQKEALEICSSNLLEKPACAGNMDQGETSDDESDENMISNYSIKLRRRGMRGKRYMYPETLQLRRKKLPWTDKEIKILKEGMKKFSNAGDRTIPWKKILEYGSSVLINRNTIDLKDKWRNICKGSPNCK